MVKIYKLKLTPLQQDILRILSIRSGSAINQSRLAKVLKVSQPAVAKALPKLRKIEYVDMKKDKETGRWAVQLNREDKRVINQKRILNLSLVYNSGLVDFLEENYPGTSIILFGSFSKGEDTNMSDVDIAIIGLERKTIKLEKFEEKFEKKIFLHFYKSLKDINKELKENICNGIVLAGSIEL